MIPWQQSSTFAGELVCVANNCASFKQGCHKRQEPIKIHNMFRTLTKTKHAGEVVCSEWLQLLVGCVAFKQGLLQELLACLPGQEEALRNGSSINGGGGGGGCGGGGGREQWANNGQQQEQQQQQQQQSQQQGQQQQLLEQQQQRQLQPDHEQQSCLGHHRQHQLSPLRWSHHTPVVLHIFAHELEAMVGAAGDGSSRDGASSGSNLRPNGSPVESSSKARQSSQATVPLLPWQRALQDLVGLVLAAVSACRQLPTAAATSSCQAVAAAAAGHAHKAGGRHQSSSSSSSSSLQHSSPQIQ